MIDLSKPVQTRDGRLARVLCVDADNSDYPVVALIYNENGDQYPESYTLEGRLLRSADKPSTLDLVNIVKQKSLWVNVYEDAIGCAAKTPSHAKELAKAVGGRQAMLELVFRNGQFVTVHIHRVQEGDE